MDTASVRARAARRTGRRRAFTLLELIVVVATMAVLASIALPRLSRAFERAGRAGLAQDWTTLQRQIDLYALEHDGRYPAQNIGAHKEELAQAAFVAQLTQFSNRAGDTSYDPDPDFPYGPYLASGIPALKAGPYAGLNSVRILAPDKPPVYAPGDAVGWIYQMQTGEIIPNVALTAGPGGKVTIDDSVGVGQVRGSGAAALGDVGAGDAALSVGDKAGDLK